MILNTDTHHVTSNQHLITNGTHSYFFPSLTPTLCISRFKSIVNCFSLTIYLIHISDYCLAILFVCYIAFNLKNKMYSICLLEDNTLVFFFFALYCSDLINDNAISLRLPMGAIYYFKTNCRFFFLHLALRVCLVFLQSGSDVHNPN